MSSVECTRADLVLDAEGAAYTTSSLRLWKCLQVYSSLHRLDTPFAKYSTMSVVPGIANGRLLVHLASKAGYLWQDSSIGEERVFTQSDTVDETLLTPLFQWLQTLDLTPSTDTPHLPSDLVDAARVTPCLVFLAGCVECLLQRQGVSASALASYSDVPYPSHSVSEDMVSVVVAELGQGVLAVPNVNDDYQGYVSVWGSGAWAVHACGFLGCVGLIMVVVALPTRLYRILPPEEYDMVVVSFHSYLLTLSHSVLTPSYSVANANLLAVFNLVQLFASPAIQRLSDSVGRKRLVTLLNALYALCFYMSGLSTRLFSSPGKEYAWLYAWRALSGVAAMIVPLGNVVLGDILPLQQRPQHLAFLNGITNASGILGPLLLLVISGRVSSNAQYWRWACTVAAGFCLLACLGTALFLPETAPLPRARRVIDRVQGSEGTDTEGAQEGVSTEPDGWLATFNTVRRDRNLVMLIVAYTLTLSVFKGGSDMAGVILMQQFGFSRDAYSAAAVIFCAVCAFGGIVLAKPLMRRVGERMTTHVGHALAALALVLYQPLVSEYTPTGVPYYRDTRFWLFNLTLGLLGLSDGVAQPSSMSMFSLYATPFNKGSVLGIAQIGNSLGRSLPTMALGYLYAVNPHLGFGLFMVLPVIAALLTHATLPPLQLHAIRAEGVSRDRVRALECTGHRLAEGDAMAVV
ncbi:major facilitator superfamily protein [Kipferlia bialata]|uniref:Major facilitator superfamily protein n=1 Tax=Kipferlia bialata TaxID=797122 RepID=A0A391NI62_9EUKA|nr:major facilitator superfamily protein [Kipferlia bialata]GCA62420.1 major facilitator superfamily protein [Kipferlia bialata]|eukprot:g525.t1